MPRAGRGDELIDPETPWTGWVAGPEIAGVVLAPVDRHDDERGWFTKVFQRSTTLAGGGDATVAEVYLSRTARGVVRGLHLQVPPHDHAKTVACIDGAVLDVVVDLRTGSPTEGQAVQVRLDAGEPARLHIPRGVAHGFQALSPDATLAYVVGTEHAPTHDAGVHHLSVGVEWPLPPTGVSARDRALPPLERFRSPFTVAGMHPRPDARADDLEGRRILLTGASGFVGAHLARTLVARGAAVAALVRPGSTRAVPDGVERVALPRRSSELPTVVAAVEPEACVHLATHFAVAHRSDEVDAMLEANIALGTHLAEALVAAGGVPLIDVGTVWQHIGSAAARPVNLYAATKVALSAVLGVYAARHGLPVARLVLADTYGPADPRPRLVPTLVAAARSGAPVPLGEPDQMMDLVHVDDVGAAFVRLLGLVIGADPALVPDAEGRTEFQVSAPDLVSIGELVALVDDVSGRRLDPRWGARPRRDVEMRSRWIAAPSVPGWRPRTPLRAGLEDVWALSGGSRTPRATSGPQVVSAAGSNPPEVP